MSALSAAPGTYGQWTDADGNVDETWRVTEISSGVFCYQNDAGTNSRDRWGSREKAENAKKFNTYDNVWTRTYTPGAESWTKEG